MNRQRRVIIRGAIDRIADAVTNLRQAGNILDRAAEEEQDAVDNTPENFQATDRYYDSEAAADTLADAADSLSDIITQLQGIL